MKTPNDEKEKPPKRIKYGLPRFSTLEYVLFFAALTRKLEKVTNEQIFNILAKTRYEIERRRQAESAIGRDLFRLQRKLKTGAILKTGAAVDFTKFCITLNLIEKSDYDGCYVISQLSKSIGEAYAGRKEDEARLLLLDSIIRCGQYALFDPTRFLLPIRNNSLEEVVPFRTVTTRDPVTNVKKKKTEPIDPISIGEEEGTGYKNDFRFIYEVLHTNPVRLDVMLDWGYFFQFLNFFWPNFNKPIYPKEQGKKYYIPNKGFYICKIVVSFSEILRLMEILEEKKGLSREIIGREIGLTRYATTCLLYACLILDIIRVKENNEIQIVKSTSINELVQNAFRIQAVVLCDGDEYRGLANSPGEVKEANHSYLILNRDWSLSKFFNTTLACYRELVGGDTVLYASIFRLREKICRSLRMHDEVFDEKLRMCIKSKEYSNRISLGLMSPERRLKRGVKARGVEKAFKLGNKSYFQVKLR